MSHLPNLITARLTLRQLLPSDDRNLLSLRSNYEVNRYLDRSTPKDITDARQFIDSILEHKRVYWAITLRSPELIGTICLFNFSEDRLSAELGYELHPDFQGQGIMDEALKKVIGFGFDILRLEKIVAFTHRDNQQSVGLLEKNEFVLVSAQEDDPYDQFVRKREP